MMLIYFLSLTLLVSCSSYPPPFKKQPPEPQINPFKKYSKKEGLRLFEQKYAQFTLSSFENEKTGMGLGDGTWSTQLPATGIFDLPISEQEKFVRELVSRYGIGCVFFDQYFSRYFADKYDWALFVKQNEHRMTPAAKYCYETWAHQQVEEALEKGFLH